MARARRCPVDAGSGAGGRGSGHRQLPKSGQSGRLSLAVLLSAVGTARGQICTRPGTAEEPAPAYTLTNIANLTSGVDFDVSATCASGWQGTASAASCPSPGTDFVLTGCDPKVCTRPDAATLPAYTIATSGNLDLSTGPLGVTAVCADGYGTGAYPYGTVATVTTCADHDTPFSVSGCAAQECSQSVCQITQQVDPVWDAAAQAAAPVNVSKPLCCVSVENQCAQNHEGVGNHTQLSSDVGEVEGRLAMYNEPYEGFQVSCGLGWALKSDPHGITGGNRSLCCEKKGCSAFACSVGTRLVDAADLLPFEDIDATQDTCCQVVEDMCGGNMDSSQDFNDCRAWTSLTLNPEKVFSSYEDSADDRRLACCVLPEMDLMAMIAGVLLFGCAAGSGIMAVVKGAEAGKAGASGGDGPQTFSNPLMGGDEEDPEAEEEPAVPQRSAKEEKAAKAAYDLEVKAYEIALKAHPKAVKAAKKKKQPAPDPPVAPPPYVPQKAGKKSKKDAKKGKKGGKKMQNPVQNPMMLAGAEVDEAERVAALTPAAAPPAEDPSVLAAKQAEEKLKIKDEKLVLLEGELKALHNAHEDEGAHMSSHTEALLAKVTKADAASRKWKAMCQSDQQALEIASADAKLVVERANKDVAASKKESAERLAKMQAAEKENAATKQKLEKELAAAKEVAARHETASAAAVLEADKKVKIAQAKQQEEFQKVVNMEAHTKKIEAEVEKLKKAHKAETSGEVGAVAAVHEELAGSVAEKMQSLVEEARNSAALQREHDATLQAMTAQTEQQVTHATEAATVAKAESAKATAEKHAMEAELLTLRQEHEAHKNSASSEITEKTATNERIELNLASKSEVVTRLEGSLAAKEVEMATDKENTDKILSNAAAVHATLTTKLTKVTQHRAELETELAKVKLEAMNAATEAKKKYDMAQQDFKAALQAQADKAAAAAIEAAKLLEEEQTNSAAAMAEAKEAHRVAGEKARLLVEKAMAMKKASDDKVIEKQKEQETTIALYENRLVSQKKASDEEKETALAAAAGLHDAAAAEATRILGETVAASDKVLKDTKAEYEAAKIAAADEAAALAAKIKGQTDASLKSAKDAAAAAVAEAAKLLADTTAAADQKLAEIIAADAAVLKQSQGDATAAATAAGVAAATELRAANDAADKAAAEAAKLLADTTKSSENATADAAKLKATELKAASDAAAKAAAEAAKLLKDTVAAADKLLADTTKASDKLLADTKAAATAELKKANDDGAAAAKAAAAAAAAEIKAANDAATNAAASAAKLLDDTTKSLEKAAVTAAANAAKVLADTKAAAEKAAQAAASAAAAELKATNDAATKAAAEAAKLLKDTIAASDKLLADTTKSLEAAATKAAADAAKVLADTKAAAEKAAQAAASVAAAELKATSDAATKAAAEAAKVAQAAASAAAAELKASNDAAIKATSEAAKVADAEAKTRAMEATSELREVRKDYDAQLADLNKALAEQTKGREKAAAAIAAAEEKLENQKTIVKEQAEHAKLTYKKLEEKHASLQEKAKAKMSGGGGD